MNDTIALRYIKFNRLLTFHLQSVSFPCRKMVFSDDDKAVIKNDYVEKGWSQEESPGTHMPPSNIERKTGLKISSIVRMVKKNVWKQYKRIKTPRMSEGTKKQQTERAGALAERFSNKRSAEKCVWQDEKDFMLEVPLNHLNSRVYDKKPKR